MDLNQPTHDEPDYLTPLDVYAGQALNGMLAQGGYSHLTDELAEKAFALAGAMVRARTRYFQQNPVGGHPLANSMPPIVGQMAIPATTPDE